jgi:PAS domain S-box-containing protein
MGADQSTIVEEIESNPIDLLCLLGRDGYYKSLSPGWQDLLGYPKAELLEEPYTKLVHPDDIDFTKDEMAKLFDGDKVGLKLQNRFRTKNGKYLWLDWRVVNRGGILFATARDITSFKKESLYLKNIQESARVGGWTLDVKTGHLYWSEGVFNIHELPTDTQIDTKVAIDFYLEEERPKVTQYFEDCVANKKSFNDVFKLKTASGKEIWARVIGEPVTDSEGSVLEVTGTFQDVTDTVAASKELERNYKFTSDLIENSPGILYQFIARPDGTMGFHYVNSKGTDLLGFSQEEMIEGEGLMAHIHEEDMEELGKAIEKSAMEFSLFSWEGRVYTKSGEVKDVIARSIPQKLDGGGLFWNGVFLDVSELVRLQRELDEERKKLLHSAKLASIGELAAGVGHEINNPLLIAKGNIEFLRDDAENGEIANKRLIDTVEVSLDRITDIVNSLRSYARSDGGDIYVFNVTEVISRTVGLISGIYHSEGIMLKAQFERDDIRIKVSEGRLQQALMNLIANARDALRSVKDPTIEFTVSHQDDIVKIGVRDNGCGIPDHLLDRIFDSFFTTKVVGEGTGMGLGITRQIIESMNGTISVKSQEGKGSLFEISLPLTKELPAEKPSRPVQAFDKIDGSVLIVDDEPFIIDLLRKTLEEIGLNVSSAEDGIAALELIKSESYDFVISDLKMPKMSGEELFQKFQELGLHETKFIMLTGGVEWDPRFVVADHFKGKVWGFLNKPFTRGMLLEVLTRKEEEETVDKAS